MNKLWSLRCGSKRCHWQDLQGLKKPRRNMGRRRNWPNPSDLCDLCWCSSAMEVRASVSQIWRAEPSAAAIRTISNNSATPYPLLESESSLLFPWWHSKEQSFQYLLNSARHPLVDSEIYVSALSPPNHYTAQKFHKPQANPHAVGYDPWSRFQRCHRKLHYRFCGCTMELVAATCFNLSQFKLYLFKSKILKI